jgi:hypothetical protein|tara:strand:- start:34 stop:1158 length:1125 start_codon:yes stop_codon:yes gene_type:complete
MTGETAYINGGEIYKKQVYFSGNYDPDNKFNYVTTRTGTNTVDSIAPFSKHQDGKIKIYTSTKEARKWYSDEDSGESLSGYDLCPSVTLWWGKGIIDNENYDLYFRVDNATMLNQVASYYSLPYPINSEIEVKLNTPASICTYSNYLGDHLVLGAVKFINGVVSILKMYCLYKEDNLLVLQKAKSLHNGGEVFEQGTLTTTVGPERLKSFVSTTATQSTQYNKNNLEGEPFFKWNAVITEDGLVKTKNYESSKQYRTAIANLTTGNDYSSYNLCPSVNLWIGRSWIEDGEEELYFYLENSSMLESVATYYNLPEPCNSVMKSKINSNPENFRLRHMDVYKLGVGNWVPLVVASIVFNNNVATMFKLYEITRWNE